MPRTVSTSTDSPNSSSQAIRLQKLLAAAGIGSRRKCEELILAGRVSVDGKSVQELGTRVDPRKQKILLDGERVRLQPKRYYLLNKPAGCLCTNSDPAGRQRAIDLVPQDGTRWFTAGRLDENSEGLLLVTNDGELANLLTHPRYQIERTYHVQVAGNPTRETMTQMKRGLYFPEGTFRVKKVRRLRSRGNSTFLELTLTEGRNREVRRMLARIGHKVLHLKRTRFGPLSLGRLAIGRCRPLTPTELKTLRELLDPKPKRKPVRRKRRPHA